MVNSKCSCKNCSERYLGCHDKCEKYLSYRKELDKRIEDRTRYLKESAPFHEIKSKWANKKLREKGHY